MWIKRHSSHYCDKLVLLIVGGSTSQKQECNQSAMKRNRILITSKKQDQIPIDVTNEQKCRLMMDQFPKNKFEFGSTQIKKLIRSRADCCWIHFQETRLNSKQCNKSVILYILAGCTSKKKDWILIKPQKTLCVQQTVEGSIHRKSQQAWLLVNANLKKRYILAECTSKKQNWFWSMNQISSTSMDPFARNIPQF